MKLPFLASQPNGISTPATANAQKVPTRDEWAARYSEIERLYIHERRKLRFVMRYMERKYGFRATEQMYKKRFAKWGFHKNSRCSETAVPISAKRAHARQTSKESSLAAKLISKPTSLQLSHDDGLSLGFLISVRIWSETFFESTSLSSKNLSGHQECCLTQRPAFERAKEVGFTLKVVDDLLDRGHGALAGRMARKAFLLIESILALKAPVLIWNLLEVMHHMMLLRHEELFQILLVHLIGLVKGQKSGAHPLLIILQKLHLLVRRIMNAPVAANSRYVTTSPLSSPYSSNGTTASSKSPVFSQLISALLEEAWVQNANIILQHFEPQFFPLYAQLQWESCSINMPSVLIDTTKQWLKHMEVQQTPITIPRTRVGVGVEEMNIAGEEKMLQSLLNSRADASPPQHYAMLRDSSIAMLRRYGYTILSKGLVPNNEDARSLSVLPALVKASFVEQNASIDEQSDLPLAKQTKVPREQAGHMACVLRALVDLNREHGGKQRDADPGTVERLRSLIALREYACGEIDPQVIREMWLLEDALVLAGNHTQAQKVGKSVIHRLEMYMQDVPSSHT